MPVSARFRSVAIVPVVPVVAVLLALPGCSKGKLEAKVKGYAPGSKTTVVIHVKGDKGATVDCATGGLACQSVDLGAAGEGDVEIDEANVPPGGSKVVFLHEKIGRREATTSIDLGNASGLPAAVDVNELGTITCVSRTCNGLFGIAPSGSLSLTAAAGTKVDVGSEHFTVPAGGQLTTSTNVTTTPAMKDVPLAKLCTGTTGTAVPLGSTKMTLTFADGASASTDVAMTTHMANMSLGPVLSDAVKKGPVAFPWEKPGTPPNRSKHTAIYVTVSGCEGAGGAADAKLGDVTVIAVSDTKPRTDTCTYALNEKTSGKSRGTSTGKITLNDEEATAFDRFTGKKLGTKLFAAPKTCDPDLKLDSAADTIKEQTSYASTTAIAAWAATLH